MSEGQHYLVVTEIGDGLEPPCEWEVEHPPGCMTDDSQPYYTCMIGAEFEGAGLDAIGGESELPPAGRYPLTGHAIHSPSLPTNGGEEWWVEIEVGEREG